MTQSIRDVMTSNPTTVTPDTSLTQAASIMRDQDIGDVLVAENGALRGMLTDRDVVIRGIAAGMNPSTATVGDICTVELATLTLDSTVEEAIQMIAQNQVRRIPVVDKGQPIGIVSLGDLAVERDPSSALGQVSASST